MRGPYYVDIKDRQQAGQVMRQIGCDAVGITWMQDKARIYPLLLKDVKSPAANILKQHMLSLGGEAAVDRWVVNQARETSDVLLLGTLKQYHALKKKLICQHWGLKTLAENLNDLLYRLDCCGLITWKWSDLELEIGDRTLVMGIINVTPDSFYPGSRTGSIAEAVERAKKMVAEGADLLDVGAESTRPGSRTINTQEEQERLLPVLKALLSEVSVPISVDTYKADTARAALELGVHIINDVGGGMKDPAMAEVVAAKNAHVILMHNPSQPTEGNSIPSENGRQEKKALYDCLDSLAESAAIYEKAGLAPDHIMLDPGIGFGKTWEENLLILKNLSSFRMLGKPVLLGVSRKSFIGRITETDVDERLEGSLASGAWGAAHGADVLRVHDVKETVRMLQVLDAIRSAGVNYDEI